MEMMLLGIALGGSVTLFLMSVLKDDPPSICGFFDADKISPELAAELVTKGFHPVLGDPNTMVVTL